VELSIGFGRGMTPIDIELIRSKVKVRRTTLKKGLPLIILKIVYHRAFIFHMVIGLGDGLTPIDFVFFRVKVTFVKKGFHLFS